MKRDLHDWRSKLDVQVKGYRSELGELKNTLHSEVDQLRTVSTPLPPSPLSPLTPLPSFPPNAPPLGRQPLQSVPPRGPFLSNLSWVGSPLSPGTHSEASPQEFQDLRKTLREQLETTASLAAVDDAPPPQQQDAGN